MVSIEQCCFDLLLYLYEFFFSFARPVTEAPQVQISNPTNLRMACEIRANLAVRRARLQL